MVQSRSRKRSPRGRSPPCAAAVRAWSSAARPTPQPPRQGARRGCAAARVRTPAQNSHSGRTAQAASGMASRVTKMARSARSGRVTMSSMPFSKTGRAASNRYLVAVGPQLPHGKAGTSRYATERIGQPRRQGGHIVEREQMRVVRGDEKITVAARHGLATRAAFGSINARESRRTSSSRSPARPTTPAPDTDPCRARRRGATRP